MTLSHRFRVLSMADLAVGQNQWYHFGVGAPPILVYFRGDWDVHYWGYGLLTHGHLAQRNKIWGAWTLSATPRQAPAKLGHRPAATGPAMLAIREQKNREVQVALNGSTMGRITCGELRLCLDS